LLDAWGASENLVAAGLCHAVYGTDGFPQALVDHLSRGQVRDVIGHEAEQTVYLYASCDRRFVFPQLGSDHLRFRDRFTDEVFAPDPAGLRDFVELTFANELDVARHSAAFAAGEWSTVARVFSRCERLVSSAGWDAYQRVRPANAPGTRGHRADRRSFQ
jgi:hypothetical protein